MKEGHSSAANAADREIAVTRIFNAPRELVYKVWTDPNHIALWWGPKGFTNTIEKMEVKPGGVWLFVMHGPDGLDYPNKVVYLEVKKPERLVYDHGDKGEPNYHRVTVTFEKIGKTTKVSMTMLFTTAEHRNEVVEKYNAVEGLNQNMDKLAAYLLKM